MSSFTKTLTLVVAGASAVYGLFPVTGVQGDTFPRFEIRDLHANHKEQWDLYIQALQAFHDDDNSQLGSYYQISAIHGLPNDPWDGVTGDGGGTGYCCHGMNLFPTWHRPYIALFEQQLQSHAVSIANTYPDSNKQVYLDAANQLRSPYIDWAINPAAGKNSYPDELSSETIDVTLPSGPSTVTNPLYQYHFASQQPTFGGAFTTWPNTLRYPTSQNPDATSNQGAATQVLGQAQPGMKSGVFQLLTNCPDYMLISMDANNGNNGCPSSLESLHNSFHVNIGGQGDQAGHMTVVPVSGYDPSFMLHHTMVDRLFAMWQVMYPDSWLRDEPAPGSTYAIRQGDTIGAGSPLSPFRDPNGNYWTSDAVRNVETFHYTYPELQQANGDPNTMAGIVGNLYGDNAGATAAKKSKRTFGQKYAERRDGILTKLLAGNGSSWQYNANIATSKYALGGSFSINIFFDDPTNPNPLSWGYDKNLVGSYGVFASQFMKGSTAVSSSTVSLTKALSEKVDSGELASLDPSDVRPYLTKHIQWRIVGPDGKEVDPADVPSLKVGVVSSTLSPRPNLLSTLTQPLWSTFNLLSDITQGKVGGV